MTVPFAISRAPAFTQVRNPFVHRANANRTYAAETETLIARFSTPPTTARKNLIDDLIVSLKTAGLWSKMDLFYILAAADSQAASLNWVNSSYTLTAVGSPTFTADQGYTGNGTNSELQTGYTPSTNAVQLTQNSAHLGVMVLNDGGAQNRYVFGASGNLGVRCRSGINGQVRVTQSTALSGTTSASFPLHMIGVRRDASNIHMYRKGGLHASGASTSAALGATAITILKFGTDFSTQPVLCAHLGAALSDSEATLLTAAVRQYMTGVGIALPAASAPLYVNSIASTSFDYIQTGDTSTFSSVAYVGFQSGIEMPGDPGGGPLVQSAYVFNATFSNGQVLPIHCNEDFTNSTEAQGYVDKLSGPLGRLPVKMRTQFNRWIIHKGDGTFTSESRGHFGVFYSDKMDLRISNNDLEESTFHEGMHAAFQEEWGGKGYSYISDPRWTAAVIADNAYITDYAATANQEDFAESALFAYTIIQGNGSRLAPDLAAIESQIPNRIAFFRDVVFA